MSWILKHFNSLLAFNTLLHGTQGAPPLELVINQVSRYEHFLWRSTSCPAATRPPLANSGTVAHTSVHGHQGGCFKKAKACLVMKQPPGVNQPYLYPTKISDCAKSANPPHINRSDPSDNQMCVCQLLLALVNTEEGRYVEWSGRLCHHLGSMSLTHQEIIAHNITASSHHVGKLCISLTFDRYGPSD